MSAVQDAAIQFAIDQAERARDDARRAAQASTEAAVIRLGVVSAISAGGAYTVDLIDAAGETAGSLPGLRAWGAAVFAAGDKVAVVWIGDRPIPVLLAGGGSGGGGGSYVVTGELGFAS